MNSRTWLKRSVLLLLSSFLLLGSLSKPASAADFYVDAAIGDDSRAPIDAQSPNTPWRTVTRALRAVTAPGHRVIVRPGRYEEAPQTHTDGVALLASDEPGRVVIAPPPGSIGVLVNHRNVEVEGIVFEGGSRAVRAERADGLRIRRCTAIAQTSDAITVIQSSGVVIDSTAVISGGARGMHLENTGDIYLRNNLIYDNAAWGIDLSGGSTAASRQIAFNTIAYNGSTSGGGIRIAALAELRDSVIAFNDGVGLRVVTSESSIHHNNLFGSPVLLMPEGQPLGGGMLSLDPGFVLPAGPDGVLGEAASYLDDNFSLRQVAGEEPFSPLLDKGSGPVATRDISGSTATDGRSDVGVADLGFHQGSEPSIGAPTPSGGPSSAVYNVDCATGDDSRTKVEALNPATPWKTMRRAALGLAPGETVLVHPGVCPEGVETRVPRMRFIAAQPGTVVLEPPEGVNGFNLQHDGSLVDGFVIRSPHQGLLAARSKAWVILRDITVRNLVVEPPLGGTIATNGIQIRDAENVLVENSVVRGAQQSGILFKRVNRGYVRNNLVLEQVNEWGIVIDGDSPNRFAPTVGNVVAFNTVWRNLGGIRLKNSWGEIRDNIAVENPLAGIKYGPYCGNAVLCSDAAIVVHHNNVWDSATPYDLPSGIRTARSNLELDPGLLDPTTGRFALRQVPGEEPFSPLLDKGSGPVGTRDISGSTASDDRADTGIADIGYHAGAAPSAFVPPILTTVEEPDTFYIDCATGDDNRSKYEAANPATPWRTIRRSTFVMTAGETAVVLPGVCPEGVETRGPGLSFVAGEPGTVVLEPPPGVNGFNLQHDGSLVDGFVIRSPHQGLLAARSKAWVILRDITVRNLVVEPPLGGTIATNGIQIRDAENVIVENSVVRGAQQSGILFKRVNYGYIRNNLVLDQPHEWGIVVDGDSPNRFAPTVGNVVAFNTVWRNYGGIRLKNSWGEIRDNIAVENPLAGIKYGPYCGNGVLCSDAAIVVHHNNVWQSATPYDLPSGIRPARSNLELDPGLLDPATGRFALRQVPGEEPFSPLLDKGSGPVGTRDISGSTASDDRADTGIADMGFHAGAGPSLSIPPPPQPPVPPSGPPAPGSGRSFYVDPVSGNDARLPTEVGSPSTAWRTIGRAINAAKAGDVVLLRPGIYAQQADFNAHSVTLRGDGPFGEVVIRPPPGKSGVYVNGFANAQIENIVVENGVQGVVARNAPGVRITKVAVIGSSSNGIVVEDSESPWVDGCIVTGSGAMGIKVVRSAPIYVRNNLVYTNGDWGISLDHSIHGVTLPTSTGNVVAFNTVHANRSGIRLLNATTEVRDNNVTYNTDVGVFIGAPNVTLHHNHITYNRKDRDSRWMYEQTIAAWSNIGSNPRYVDPPGGDGILGGLGWRDDDFRLRQVAAGDTVESPSVDSGSGLASTLEINGSTSSDGTPDTGIADIGYHYGASPGNVVPPPMPIGSNLERTYYVNVATGDDTRSTWSARRAETPWRTIHRAIQKVAPGDTVIVAPGVYTTGVRVEVPGVKIVADAVGDVVLRPQGGVAFTIAAPNVVIDGVIVEAASTGFSMLAGGDGAVLRNCAVVGPGSDGIRAKDVTDLEVENCVVASPGGSGIRLRRVGYASLRNNLLYDAGEWGISSDADGVSPSAIDVAGSTLMGNRAGGLQIHGSGGLVRDNLFTDSGGVGVKINDGSSHGQPGASPYLGTPALEHNGFIRNRAAMDPADYLPRCAARCAGNRTLDPLYVSPAGDDGVLGGNGWRDDNFRLAEGSSPAIDAGSDLASELGTTGTTVPSGMPDEGIVDLGFHYESGPRALVLPDPDAAGRRGALPGDGDWSDLNDSLVLHSLRRAELNARIPRIGSFTAQDSVSNEYLDMIRPQRLGGLLPAPGEPPIVGPGSQVIDFGVRRALRASVQTRFVVGDGCGEQVLRVGRPRSLLLPATSDAGEPTPGTEGALLCRHAAPLLGAPPGPKIHIAVGAPGEEEYFDVIGLSRVCLPAQLSGSPKVLRGNGAGQPVALPPSAPGDPSLGRTCYRVRSTSAPSTADCVLRTGAAAAAPTSALRSVFGAEALRQVRLSEICLATTLSKE